MDELVAKGLADLLPLDDYLNGLIAYLRTSPNPLWTTGDIQKIALWPWRKMANTSF